MPQVPYKPVSEVSSGFGTGTSGLDIKPQGAAFGTNIAAALEKFGATTEQSGGELFSRAIALQQMKNEADARDAVSNYIIDQGMLHAQFNAAGGEDQGPKALQKYIADSRALQQRYGQSLTNPYARHLYANESQNQFARNVFNAAGVSATATKHYAAQKEDAYQSSVINSITPESTEKDVNADKARIEQSVRRKHDALGTRDEGIIQEETNKRFDLVEYKRIDGLTATDPKRARQIFEAVKDKISDPSIRDKLEAHVELGEDKNGSQLIVDDVTKRLTADSSADDWNKARDRALREAEEQSPNNKQLARFVNGDFDTKRNRILSEARQNSAAIREEVGKWLNSSDPVHSVKDPADIQRNPQIWEMFKNLSRQDQDALYAQIKRNAAMDTVTDTDARKANYQYNRGLATTDKRKFLDQDFSIMDLTAKERIDLVRLQSHVKSGLEAPSHADAAFHNANVINSLANVGLTDYKGKPLDDEAYTRFRGIVESDFANYQERMGKPPDPDYAHKRINELLNVQIQTGLWLPHFLGGGQQPLYKEGLPEEVQKDIRRMLKDEGDTNPTDEEVMRRYLQLRK